MRHVLPSFAALAFLALAQGCGGTAAESRQETEDPVVTSARNEDVQVLKVTSAPSFGLSKTSIYQGLDQEECVPEGKTWAEIKAWDTAVSGYLSVKLDCTDAVARKYGIPSMRAVTVEGYRTKKAEEAYYGYVGFSNSGGVFWVKTVELAVKESAIASPSFHGVGFYLNAFSYRYYEARPAPGPDNGNGYFVFADQVRARTADAPTATLPNGDRVRILKIALPAAYALGGTSSVPGFYFRPFAEYAEAGDKHQRWDPVASDYFVGTNTEFDRAGDVLAR